jgi:hypothetical protein
MRLSAGGTELFAKEIRVATIAIVLIITSVVASNLVLTSLYF